MRILPVTGIILGVLAGVILLCLSVTWFEKRYSSETYDERQKLVQGKASSLSFTVGVIYFLIVLTVLINQVEGNKTIEPYLLVFMGVLLMLVVDHTYCLIGHAALPLSQKPLVSIIGYVLMGLVDLWYFVSETELMPLALVGTGSKPFIYLLIGIGFLYLALMHAIAWLRDRKQAYE